MSAHAKLSPSKRHRWAVCPGSIREEARYPESSSGPAAIDGTHSHTLLEHCIKNNLRDPQTLVGQTLTDHDGAFTVDRDRAGRVALAVDYIRSRVNEYGGHCEVLAEERVDPAHLTGRDDLSGTVDCQLWGGNVLEVIDYKDGMGVVEAKDNLQLEQYAIGVLARFKLTPFEPYPFDTVRTTIIQPKLATKGMRPISSHDVSVTDLLARLPQITAEAAATDHPEAPLVPGEKQCKFCQHKGACSALAGDVMKEVGLMFSPIQAVEVNPLDMAQQSAEKNPTAMTDDQIRQVLEAAPLVRQFIEGVEAEALRRLESGQSLPGFKLVRGRGSRSWTLPEDQMAEKLIKMGIPKGAVYETKLISPAKAEKLVWTKKVKNEEVSVQLSDKQLQRLETEYIAKSSGKMTVVPESDSRPAVVTNAAPMFAPVAPEPALPAWLL